MRASCEAELIDTLDQVADPGLARWSVYNGPLWIDLALPLTEDDSDDHGARLDQAAVEHALSERELPLRAELKSGCDAQWEMMEAIGRKAFPALQRAIEAYDPDSGDNFDAAVAKAMEAASEDRAAMDRLHEQRVEDLARTASPGTQLLMQVTGSTIDLTKLRW